MRWVVMGLMADSRSWRSHCHWMGVCPRGAHVHWTEGRSENPLSSTKTIVAPWRAAFFLPPATSS